MRFLAVHPGPLMYTKVFLRLEPLGLELVAAALRRAGHRVRIVDLQAEPQRVLLRQLREWRPEAVGFSLNYLANVPEVLDLARLVRAELPDCFIFIGGHSASFIAAELLEHGAASVDCVLQGEGEANVVALLDAVREDRAAVHRVPGVFSQQGQGPRPGMLASLDEYLPARDLLRHRRRYFLGILDPCASIEFSRGCPWDCSFCSAWTFYGRSYRIASPDKVVDELASIREPGVFIVDDVAFIQDRHGLAIGEAIARRGIRKQYYLETRGDVLLRNREVFRYWKSIGLKYMFMGLEAVDEEGLKKYRKRVPLGRNFEALEYARSLGITVAINLIADPDWDRQQFKVIRDWCLEIPEIVNISINTPYPGTESWHTETRPLTSRDYRLYDIQHAVLPTRLPLPQFYAELVETQRVLARKHMGWAALSGTLGIVAEHLGRGQTNFLKSLWKFNSVYDPRLQLADHAQPVRYLMRLPDRGRGAAPRPRSLYVHAPSGRRALALDTDTQRFVDDGRVGTAP